MVNYPAQRLGPSGPFAQTGGGGSTDFAPADNILFFDPNFSGGDESGSIADPFLNWADWVAGVPLTEGSTKVIFPGVPVAPDADALPFSANSLVIEGLTPSAVASFINGEISIPANDTPELSVEFRYIGLEALLLNGGPYTLLFSHCLVRDLTEDSGDFTGSIIGEFTSFEVGQTTPDANVRLTGGNLLQWDATTFDLTNVVIGTLNGSDAGELTVEGQLVKCRGVTFVAGSTITFANAEGELWLDGPSYKSFLSNCTLVNGHVTRDDGSWPVDAAVYNASDNNPLTIDWYTNPRALLNVDISSTTLVLEFTAPLTREVELTVIMGEGGGPGIDWTGVNPEILWSDGLAPEQSLDPGSISQYRFDYEENVPQYIGYVVVLNGLPES